MSTLEIIVTILLIISAVWGFQRGVIVQIGSLLAIVVAIIICHIFGDAATSMTVALMGGEESVTDPAQSSMSMFAAKCIGHISLFLVAWLGVWFVARTLRTMVKAVRLGFLDKICGALFMLLKCGIIISLFINFMRIVSPAGSIATASGPLTDRIAELAPRLLGFLNL